MLREEFNKGWETWGAPLSVHVSFRKYREPQISNFRKMMLIVLAFIFTITTSGVIFGFSPLLLMLEDEGVFHELCPKVITSSRDFSFHP